MTNVARSFGTRLNAKVCPRPIRSDSRKVYHGSPVYIPKPDTWHSHPPLDFGTGFYTTEFKEYARKMAFDKTAPDVETGMRHYHIMEYELDDDLADERLRILRFREPDEG